jgi:hypothetical protein
MGICQSYRICRSTQKVKFFNLTNQNHQPIKTTPLFHAVTRLQRP